jgi:peroxiredoxin
MMRIALACVLVVAPTLAFSFLAPGGPVRTSLAIPMKEIEGRVHFPVSTRVAKAQQEFDRGVFQLHCLWHADAAQSFRRAAILDPNCAMAWWGLAMSSSERSSARRCIACARQRMAHASKREQMHIDAIHRWLHATTSRDQAAREVAAAYARIAQAFPEDVESRAFYARMLFQHGEALGNPYREIEQTLASVFSQAPEHPSRHYRMAWQPWPAPHWALKDIAGTAHALSDYRGKVVIVILFLGHGCLHCVEQIQAFAPLTEKFRAAGVSLVGVSTETDEELRAALQSHGRFPFPLVANPKLDVFKAYYAFDGSRKLPMHGTYLIDGEGMICWQDISYGPYMFPEQLLQQAVNGPSLAQRSP